MNLKSITKLAAVIATVGFMSASQAVTITLQVGNGDGSIATSSSPYVLGEVYHGVVGGSQASRDASIVNALIGLSPGGSATVSLGNVPPNQTATRSANIFSPLPPAVTGGNNGVNSGFASQGNFTVSLTGGWMYLVAQWDGENGGAMAYDIASLGAGDSLILPINAYGHGVTAYTLLNPGTTRVPDGGATVALLGLGIAGLGALRRKIS